MVWVGLLNSEIQRGVNMTIQLAKIKKFAGVAVTATAVGAAGLGLGAGTAQAMPKPPTPPRPPIHQVLQHTDNFFDRFVTGEGTPIDRFFDGLNGVK
jgi:hypothetical protein